MYHIFIHLSISGHLGCFHVLAIVNSATVNIRVHASFWIMFFSGYMPSSGIAGSYSSFIPVVFFFLRNLHIVLHSACYQFTFPPIVHEGSFFSTSSPVFIVCRWGPCFIRQLPTSYLTHDNNIYISLLLSVHSTLSFSSFRLYPHLCLYSCPENRFISTIFLDSIWML